MQRRLHQETKGVTDDFSAVRNFLVKFVLAVGLTRCVHKRAKLVCLILYSLTL